MPKRKLKMPSQRMNGSFKPETFNEEENTVEVVFTTGQGGKRYDWYNDVEYIEELDVTPNSVRTERLDKGLSVIDNHRTYNGIDGVFGVTEGYRFENGELIGTIRFASDEKSMERATKVKDGILRHVSLGYKVHKYLKSRGENDKLDTYRAMDWEATELSFVPVSFETTNGVRAEQRENEPTFTVEIEETNMNEEQRARLALLQGMTTRSDAENTELNALLALQSRSTASTATPAPAATPAATPAPAPVVEQVDTGKLRTEERGALQPMIDAADKAGLKQEFAIRAFSEGKTIDQFRGLVIDELGKESSDNIIRNQGVDFVSDDRNDAKAQTRTDAENALLYRCGANVEGDGHRNFSGLTLFDMAREFVIASGENVRGLSRQAIASRAFHSTSDFPLILENVMNKNLQAAYQETPQTFRDLGRRTTVNDFRDKNTYSLGDAPNLLPLGEHGEYKAGTFSEGKEKYSIGTYARKIGFTRKMLINDDMSALDRMPSMFGAAGSRLESDIVWGLLLNYDFFKGAAANILMGDGKALFHADHGNLKTGAAASALTKTGLSNMRQLGRKMKTIDGNFMNVMYNEIVVPEELETSAEDILVNNILANQVAETNQFRGKLGYRVEPRLSVVSQTAWYLFSQMVDTFEYAYLSGEENMMVEVVNQNDVDGMQVNVRKDFGAGLVDYRGMAKATGA